MKHHRTIQSIPYFKKWFRGAPLRVGGMVGALVLLLLLLTGGTAQAQSCTTTVTTATDSGAGSLRNAISSVAANGTICFNATFNTPQTIPLTTGTLLINKSLTISGTGAENVVLSGANAARVISVTTGVNVTLKNLTVRDGFVANQAGGGIYSSGALTLTAVNILSSTAGTSTPALGGALHVTGTLVYSGGLVSGNTAYRGGGVYVNGGRATLTGVDIFTNTSTSYGGGLYSKGALTVSATAVISNAATAAGTRAGGVYLDGGTAQISDSVVGENVAASLGGGMYVAASAVLTVTRADIYSNTATSGGGLTLDTATGIVLTSTVRGNLASAGTSGGINVTGASAALTMTGSVVSDNTASGNGGGVYVYSGRLALYNSQVLSNTSSNGAGGGVYATNTGNSVRVYAGSRISGNRAAGSSGGGGIYINTTGSILEVVASTISENAASMGGGFYSSSAGVLLDQATIQANTAITYGGGGIYVSNGTLLITGTTIISNSAVSTNNGQPGGGYIGGATTTIANSYILSNTAAYNGNSNTYGGGGLSIAGSAAVTFTNTSLAGNQVNGGYGGALLINSITSPGFLFTGDNRIYGNVAKHGGGGISAAAGVFTMMGGAVYSNTTQSASTHTNGGGGLLIGANSATTSIFISGTTIYNNLSAGDGGGLHLIDGAATLVNSTVTSNTVTTNASFGGGGVSIYKGTLTLTDTVLAGNVVNGTASYAGGGGLYIADSAAATVTVRGGSIMSNTAKAGGGIYLTTGVLTLQDTPVQENRASGGNGGGLYVNTGAQATLTNTAFYSNTTTQSGGAISTWTGGVLTATTITLSGNRATSNGGGAYLYGSTSLLRAVQVYSNTANGQGGGFFLNNSTLLLTDASIDSNTAGSSGGGLRVVDSTATLISGTVSDNRATGGAGISLNGSSSATPANLRLTDATIANNAASSFSGGGIALGANTGVTMTRTSIYANRATSSGGGIHLDVLSSWLDVDASSIYSNTSADGGGIYSQGPLTLTNSTVAHNQASASGGGLYLNGGLLQTLHATLADNTAATQGGGLFLNAGTATLSNTLVANSTTNGAPGGDLRQVSGALTLAQVLTGTQALGALRNNGGATWTLALPGNSPAIDAGAGCPPPTTDQRGVTRPQGSACDIGAYEAPPMLPLTVTVAGTGGGAVASTPAGIDCGASCTTSFEAGVVVTLTATPGTGAILDHWSGACGGSLVCAVTMTETKAVTATFVSAVGVTANPRGTNSISNTVYALAVDPATGKTYVGGDFAGLVDANGATSRDYLARLNPDGTVDPTFTVQTGDWVRALLRVGNYLYVGGDFDGGGTENISDDLGAVAAENVFRIDLTTGRIDRTWRLTTGLSNVYSLGYVTGTTNYLLVGMSGSGYLRALSTTNIATATTLPNFDATVRALAVDGATLYVGGGAFGTGGAPDYLRRYTFNGSVFTLDSAWTPVTTNSGIINDNVRALVVRNGYLYVGGEFDAAATDDHDFLLRIPTSSATGALDASWPLQMQNDVYALALDDAMLYVGGNFSAPGFSVARFDTSQSPPTLDAAWQPTGSYVVRDSVPLAAEADDFEDVYAIAAAVDRVTLGGDFASVNGAARSGGLAAVNKTGMTTPITPTLAAPAGSARGPYLFTGTADPGVVVTLYDGTAVVSTTVAAPDGSWSITTGSLLAIGDHRFTTEASPVYQAGEPARRVAATSSPVALSITGGAVGPTGQTFILQATGTGECTTGDDPCTGYLSLQINQDGDGDLLNLIDPPSASPKDSTNARTLAAPGANPQNRAQLVVMAYDIDWPTGEWDYVYLNGHALGRLTGASDTWNATTFEIPDLSWIEAGDNILQFRVTSDDETLYHRFIAYVSSAVLLIDGGANDQARLTDLAVPLPVAGVITPTVVITTAAAHTYRLETQLLNPDGEVVAAVITTHTLGAGVVYTSTPGILYPAADYTGYTVRAQLFYDVGGVWVPQNSLEEAIQAPLAVFKTGNGSGSIVSTPAAIDCGATCAASIDYGAVLTLTVTPDSFVRFMGWSGSCSGVGDCTVTMTVAQAVTATFIACPAGVAYVNKAAGGSGTGVDWPNAYTDLQDALRMYNTCGAFDEIWVARGLYTPGITLSDTFTIPAGVAIYGGFAATETQRTERDWAANVTVLSGDLGGDDTTDANGVVTQTAGIVGDNAYQVALLLSITSTAPITNATRLDGFTITAGNATGPGYNRYGGGLFCHAYATGSQCSPTLANVTFSGNRASVGGGMAAFAEGGESSPLLAGVRFEHNQAVIKSMGGGFAALGMFTAASPVLTDVTFYSNTAAFGGGMLIVTVSNSVSSAVLNNVLFDSNAGAVGGALTSIGYTTGASNPTLTDVTFRHNHTFIDSDYRTALNRVPYGNYVTVPTGGAIASAGYYGTAALTLTNVSLLDNRSNIGGALINFAGGGIANAMLRNTIVADNQAASGGGIANVTLAGVARLALTNGLLRDNYASTGGGALYHEASLARGEVAITNTTFYSNATGGAGGAIVMQGEGDYENPNTLHLANNILWANRAVASSNQISTSKAATVTIAASLVEGGWNGTGVGVSGSALVNGGGNLDGDPRFAEDAAGNLGLLPGSPAIDAGANSFVDSLIDLAGRLRIFNAIVDMGAYEAQGFDFTIAGSRAQTTPVSSAFTAPLQITVTDAGGQPIGAGAAVTFAPPASGAGLSSAAPFTLTTNASGVVTAPVTANGVAGSYPVTVTARGVMTPVFFTLTNLGLPVTVTVAANANPSVYGQAVIFTATVTATQGAATPAGTVVFSVDSQTVATPTLDASGIATYTAPSLTVGAHAVGASYGGDASFNAGASAPFTQTVNRAATGVALASAPNPSVYGQAVTFTATVTVTAPGAGLPTGVITFTDGAATLGTGALDVGGVATFTTSSLLAGLPGDTPALHSITAAYGGDSNFAGATSNAVDQVVNKAATTATLISGVNPAIFGQAVTFTATITVTAPGSAALAGEQVNFQEGATALGAGVLDAGGVATFTTSSLATGVHTITAHYAGTPNITGTVALAVVQVVNKAGAAVQVAAAPNPAVHGQSVTITATLTISAPGAGAPTGVVTFTAGGAPITGCTPVTLTGLQALCTTSALPTGVLTLTAEYGGDGNFTGNTGALAGGQAINRAATTAVITGAPAPSLFKQAVIFTATVSVDAPGAGVPTGVVTFTAGATSLGAAALDAFGVATVTNANLVVGDHAIAAQYGGAGDFLPTSASIYTHTVSKAGAATALNLAPNPARYGQAVIFTATVTAAASVTDLALLPFGPAGGVRFTDTTGAINLTGTLSSGVATAIGGVLLPAGRYTVTATYLGDNSYAGSASAAGVLVVVQYATQVELSSSANPTFVDNALSFTAVVSELAADQAGAAGVVTGPTGNVTIADSSGVVSLTGALVNGSVTLDAPWLPAGMYTLTAAYHGDAKYAPGVSDTFAQGVNRHGTGTALVVAPTFAFVGDAIALTATVTISDPATTLTGGITGTIDFLLNGRAAGSAGLVDGRAQVRATASLAGVFTVTASYRGNQSYADSEAGAVLLTVAKRGSESALTATPNPAPAYAEVVFTASVAELLPEAQSATVGNSPRTPSGEVIFTEASVELGRGTLIAGAATFTTSLLTAGDHAIVVHYLGDDAFLPSSSPLYTQTIQPRPLAVNDAAGTRQAESVTSAPLANDRDPAGGGLGVTALTQPAHGAAVIDGDGVHVTYTPAAEFVGLDAFTYTAQDTHGLTTTATVAVIVSAKVDSNAPQVAPVDTTQPTTITFSSGADAVVVIVPPDAYDGSAGPLGPTDIFFVAFTEIVTPSVHIATPPGGLRFAGKNYTLEVFFNQTRLEHYLFPQPLLVVLGYTPADGVNPATVQLFYWDTTAQQWSQAGLQEIGRDLVKQTITYLVSHFTEFGLFGSAVPTALEPEEEPALNTMLYLPVVSR